MIYRCTVSKLHALRCHTKRDIQEHRIIPITAQFVPMQEQSADNDNRIRGGVDSFRAESFIGFQDVATLANCYGTGCYRIEGEGLN
jgi:hypothetical protein